jgi:hypothetical protein
MSYEAPLPAQVERVTDQDRIENFVSYLKVSPNFIHRSQYDWLILLSNLAERRKPHTFQ